MLDDQWSHILTPNLFQRWIQVHCQTAVKPETGSERDRWAFDPVMRRWFFSSEIVLKRKREHLSRLRGALCSKLHDQRAVWCPGSLKRLCSVLFLREMKSRLLTYAPAVIIRILIILAFFRVGFEVTVNYAAHPRGTSCYLLLMRGERLPPRPRAGSGPRPAAAPAGGSSVGAGCRAGWRAPRPGCRARTGGGCRRRRSAASWGGSVSASPAAGPWRRETWRCMSPVT